MWGAPGEGLFAVAGPVSSISDSGTKALTASQRPWTIRVITVQESYVTSYFVMINSIVD